MLRPSALALVTLATGGCGHATPRAPAAVETTPAAVETTPAALGDEPTQTPPAATTNAGPIALLEGRFTFRSADPIELTPRDVFSRPEERQHYDAYETELDGCPLTLALVSAGLVRPDGEVVLEGAERREARDLEVVVSSHRHLETLGMGYDGVGAVIFEPDRSATDLYVWARASEEPVGAEHVEDRWRVDPEAVRCLGPAARLRDLVLATISVARPFAGLDRVHFGFSEEADDWIPYRGTLPSDWTISSGVAFDGAFEYVHRRATWTAAPPFEPTPAAKIWAFTDSLLRLDAHVPMSGQSIVAFGRSLALDTEGCAFEEIPSIGHIQILCLTGTARERDEIARVLATFAAEDGGAHPPEPVGACTGLVADETDVHVRASPSQRAPVVGDLPDGTEVILDARRGSWAHISAPIAGWIHGSRVEASVCAYRIPLAP
jgi:hypothetical protein